ncbi:subtilisin-chymotrypsin inhibitor-2A-like [Lolium rigidum]|uniref:subtilisin-chymotrypsin inhibitor-2A-like n=1 Tax=Lolium rigidum TaxID=89674 RepID=UPI001F5DFD57|nr:subtilisin-chymotrypsin inhibitor-2A-like [Lolium rigidum]
MMSSSTDVAAPAPKKTSWPELAGKTIKEAREIILKDMPDADIVVLPEGSPVTKDFRTNRVRIFVGTVEGTPHVG